MKSLAAAVAPFALLCAFAAQASDAAANSTPTATSPGRSFDSPTSLATPLVATPEVVLETEPPGEEVLGESVKLRARLLDVPSVVVTYVFEEEEAEAEDPGPTWTVIEESTEESALAVATATNLTDGLHNFRVRAKVPGKEYESELDDLLVAANAPPVTKLNKLSAYVKGTIAI